jgi:Domain of unknown function (DUF4388)
MLVNSKLTMTSKGPSDRSPPSDVRPGFQAQIKGASLGDLVQMECLAGSHRVVRVTSGGNVGFLYFRGGAVVHATARSLMGEAAALDILLWNEGAFESAEREWPANDSISANWQSLLLRAAQMRDERAAQSVVALRSDTRSPRSKPPALPAIEAVEFQATPLELAGHVLRSEDFQVVLRLGADGSLAVNQGSSQDFADIVAYACRLTELIGNQLGADRFVAMECTFKSGRCFIALEQNGDVVALRPAPAADCAALRGILGL